MTMDIFLASRNRSGWRRFTETVAFLADPANRWHEDSKERYENLTRQWIELAEHRQRAA
jgi:hypothetical protein